MILIKKFSLQRLLMLPKMNDPKMSMLCVKCLTDRLFYCFFSSRKSSCFTQCRGDLPDRSNSFSAAVGSKVQKNERHMLIPKREQWSRVGKSYLHYNVFVFNLSTCPQLSIKTDKTVLCVMFKSLFISWPQITFWLRVFKRWIAQYTANELRVLSTGQ